LGEAAMLTIPGKRLRLCDRIARRDFIRIGGLALGGLSLPQILRAEAAAGVRRSHKAVIMVYLNGGPPHQDMFDLKPEAPSEVRGEFRPIARPIHFQDVFATLYHNLGIDASATTVTDLSGRPQYLVDDGHEPIRELI
jgi:hypothetical protein